MTDLPLCTSCARPTDLCVCGILQEGDPCGKCENNSVFPLPPRLQPYKEPYFIEMRCESCGYQFTTDTRDGR